MRLTTTLLIAISLCGCGGAAKRGVAPTSAPAAPEGGGQQEPDAAGETPAIDDRAGQIDALSAEIDQWSEQLGIRAAVGSAPAPGQTECKDVEDKSECTDTCTIADSICSNSEKICTLAAELQERSADEKCVESKASCERAKAACCKCKRG